MIAKHHAMSNNCFAPFSASNASAQGLPLLAEPYRRHLHSADIPRLASSALNLSKYQTLLANSHSGETASQRADPDQPNALSQWPAKPFSRAIYGRPCSALVVINRKDGHAILPKERTNS